jgi:MarR family 2-MHQ and catechol resistance regulon transcriptional repressor
VIADILPPAQDTDRTKLWLVLMKAHQALGKHALASIAGTGLCFSDFAVLEMLLHKGPQPVNVLGAKVNLTSGSATAAIDRLSRLGSVRRSEDATDRRARIVHLTAKGRKLIQTAFQRHSTDMEAAMAGLTAEERNTLIVLLKKLGKGAADHPIRSRKGNKHVPQTVAD